MIVIAGTIPIKAEHREEARQLALWMAEETGKEAGCLGACRENLRAKDRQGIHKRLG